MCARPCLSALDTNSFDSQPPYEIGTVVIITSILQTKNQAEPGPGARAFAPGVRVWSVALGRVPGRPPGRQRRRRSGTFHPESQKPALRSGGDSSDFNVGLVYEFTPCVFSELSSLLCRPRNLPRS